MWIGDQYRFGNGYRGYLDLEADTAQEAWEFGCRWFNNKFPDAVGSSVVLLESKFVKADCDLESHVLVKFIEEYVTVALGRSNMSWEEAYTSDECI